MENKKNQIILDKKKTLSALVTLAVLLPSVFGAYKYAKNNHVIDKILDAVEYDCFYNNPYINLSRAKENNESFSFERQVVSTELLKAKEKNPDKSYLQLLTYMENDIISKYGKTPEEKRKLYMITHMELYHLLKMTPEKEQNLMILGYMNRKDSSVMDYSTEESFVNYPEMEKQSKILIQRATKQLQHIMLNERQNQN